MPTPLKVREVLRLLRRDGWALTRHRGSHRQFAHPTKPGTVTVAGKESDDIDTGTLKSIFDQAALPWPPEPKTKGERKAKE